MNYYFQTLLITEVEPFIILVTLNRPDVRNAINALMMIGLRTLWMGLATQQEKIKCIILTGAGNKAFVEKSWLLLSDVTSK